MPSFSLDNLVSIVPESIVLCLAIAVLMFDLFTQKEKRHYLAYFSIVGLVVAAYETWQLRGLNVTTFSGMFVLDGFSVFFKMLFFIVAALAILISINYLKNEQSERGSTTG